MIHIAPPYEPCHPVSYKVAKWKDSGEYKPSYNDSHSPTPPPYEPLSPCLQEWKCGSTTYRFEYCHMH